LNNHLTLVGQKVYQTKSVVIFWSTMSLYYYLQNVRNCAPLNKILIVLWGSL